MKQHLYWRNSAVLACAVALSMCLPAGGQGVQDQSKDSNSPQLMAEASTPPAALQPLAAPPAQQSTTQPPPAKSEVREAWRKSMALTPLPKKGCFKVEYPKTEWKEVACTTPPSYPLPAGRRGKPNPNSVGNTTDWMAQVTGHISTAEGSFKSVPSGITESGNTYSGASCSTPAATNVANAFTLQLNANTFATSVCNGGNTPGVCQGWQQFVYDNNGAQAYMQYWLENYGTTGTSCPAGWASFPSPNMAGEVDCYTNSNTGVGIPQQTMADLQQITMTATASSGGNDTLVLSTPSGPLNALGVDSLLQLSQGWNTAEFNIFGDGCGTVANFSTSPETTLVVKTAVSNGTANVPACVNNSFTGETNSLNLVTPCCPYGGGSPAIEFMETNAGHTASCGAAGLIGDPHITTTDGAHYDFQGAGEFVSLRDPDGLEIQTRQTPISTNFFPGPDSHDRLATCVSINTAVAARVGEHRVTWEPNLNGVPDPTGLQLRIDGARTALAAQGLALGAGGRVFPSSGGGLEIDFPDGKTLQVTPEWWASQGKWFLDVNVLNLGVVSGDGTDSGRGIAGAIAQGSWLPALPNGASMGPLPATVPERYNALYRTFADAWRVNKKDSLFDYAEGTSTDSFTNREWPSEKAPCIAPDSKAGEPASLAVAEEACRAVTDKAVHADCIFDVRATGNLGFAKAYLADQRTQADSTTTTLLDDADPSQVGELVTFTADVRPNSSTAKGVPGGAIQFAVDGANMGKAVAVDSKGEATWETSRLKVGSHRVTASYMPSVGSAYMGSTSAEEVHTVKRCFCNAERER